MKLLLICLLYPFSALYNGIIFFRNSLYFNGLFKRASFHIPVISVGNLSVGGTGKTPHIEYLIRLLGQRIHIATLSRGYGRRTKGFLLANSAHTAQDLGDEPMQFFQKFGSHILVGVGEKRALAIPQILNAYPQTQAILLDDAFQHLAVKPGLNILLTDYNKPFYDDFVLPAGRLRERRMGARRAHLVVVSKCPSSMPKNKMADMEKKMYRYLNENTPVVFTNVQYGNAVSLTNTDSVTLAGKKILLVTGIANASPLVEHLHALDCAITHKEYPDHHNYTQQELEKLIQEASSYDLLLLTEKDAVKWKSPTLLPYSKTAPIYELPIEIGFLQGKEIFDQKVLEYVGL